MNTMNTFSHFFYAQQSGLTRFVIHNYFIQIIYKLYSLTIMLVDFVPKHFLVLWFSRTSTSRAQSQSAFLRSGYYLTGIFFRFPAL